MAPPRSLLQYVCSLALFVACAQALKFDLQALSQSHDNKRERCVRNFVAKDTLVVVTAIVSGTKGDGMRVNMHVSGLLLLLDTAINQSIVSLRGRESKSQSY